MSYRSQFIGTGCHFPEGKMTNADLEKFLDTSDEWITSRTGIKERRIADRAKGESTLSMSLAASKKALEMAGLQGTDLDAIIVGTVTPESVMPTTANFLQAQLGAKNAFSFDLQAACSGFVYGVSVADHFIRGGTAKRVLVVGAETLSTLVNWKDRSTAVLFGDGAGAAILERTENPNEGIIGTKLHSDGTYSSILNIKHGYSGVPPYTAEYCMMKHRIHMAGAEVFKLAVRSMIESSSALLEEHKLKTSDVDFFIFHQANMRILDMCMKTLDVPREKTWINLDKYGNTSAATLPACLDEAWRAGAVRRGNLVLMATFGGGVTWGSCLFRL